jgi:protein NRD1
MPEVEKDEFGRDIRPQSPPAPTNLKPTQLPPPETAPMPPNDQISISQEKPSVAETSTHSSEALASEQSMQKEPENFDLTTADFSSPSSWEALATLWQSNYGYFPSTEELMGFVMSRGMGGSDVPSQSGAQHGWSNPEWVPQDTSVEQVWKGQSRGRGRGGSRGNYSRSGRGSGHNHSDSIHQGQWGNTRAGYEGQDSDAIVLSGPSSMDDNNTDQLPSPQSGLPVEGQGLTGGLGGKMQRVGDKWVFVRDSTSVVP